MIALKSGVRLGSLRPQIMVAIMVAEAALSEVLPSNERDDPTLAGDLWLTSVNDGEHRPGSLHYSGQAVDLRTRNLSARQAKSWAAIIEDRLGEEFDVVLEPDHLHIEWQPK